MSAAAGKTVPWSVTEKNHLLKEEEEEKDSSEQEIWVGKRDWHRRRDRQTNRQTGRGAEKKTDTGKQTNRAHKRKEKQAKQTGKKMNREQK